MHHKLSDWVTSRWNCYVTKQLRQKEKFPSFKEFADFVAQRAEIACNPATFFHAWEPTEEKPSRDIRHAKANMFIANVKAHERSSTLTKTYNVTKNDLNTSKRANAYFSSSKSHSCAVETAIPTTNAETCL